MVTKSRGRCTPDRNKGMSKAQNTQSNVQPNARPRAPFGALPERTLPPAQANPRHQLLRLSRTSTSHYLRCQSLPTANMRRPARRRERVAWQRRLQGGVALGAESLEEIKARSRCYDKPTGAVGEVIIELQSEIRSNHLTPNSPLKAPLTTILLISLVPAPTSYSFASLMILPAAISSI